MRITCFKLTKVRNWRSRRGSKSLTISLVVILSGKTFTKITFFPVLTWSEHIFPFEYQCKSGTQSMRIKKYIHKWKYSQCYSLRVTTSNHLKLKTVTPLTRIMLQLSLTKPLCGNTFPCCISRFSGIVFLVVNPATPYLKPIEQFLVEWHRGAHSQLSFCS